MDLPELSGSVSLSVVSGCGGTTLGLTYSKSILTKGGRVAWVAPKAPDAERFRDILGGIPITAMSRFHLLECGENITQGVDSVIAFTSTIGVDLIVIDDWTPRTGRADTIVLTKLSELVSCDYNGKTLIISAAYDDASGSEEHKSRGGSRLDEMGFEIWFLKPRDLPQSRILEKDEDSIRLKITESGFSMS